MARPRSLRAAGRSGRIFNAKALLLIGAFWAFFAFALSVGTCLALLRHELDLDTMLHDAICVSDWWQQSRCLIAATIPADSSLRQTQWLLIAFWNIALVFQTRHRLGHHQPAVS